MVQSTQSAPAARDRVVSAARLLMQQDGRADFSMRALAQQANVSSATPYNLFGSKQGIISAVVDEDLQRLQKALLEIEAGPVDAFFKLIDVVAEIFAEAPALYKAGAQIMAAPAGPGTDAQARRDFHASRFFVLRSLVADAIQAGAVSHKVNPDTFALHIGQQILSWILMWGADQITLEEMRLRTGFALAVSLLGVAQGPHRDGLQNRFVSCQTALRSFDRNRFSISY